MLGVLLLFVPLRDCLGTEYHSEGPGLMMVKDSSAKLRFFIQ